MSGFSKWSGLALVGGAAMVLTACGTMGSTTKVETPNPCEDLTVSIYFNQYSAKLTKDAKEVLREAADMRKTCAVGVVSVQGLAGSAGSSVENQHLSEQRAKAVTAALGGLGFGVVNFDAGGSAGSVTAAGEQEPLRRQAEVTFRDKP